MRPTAIEPQTGTGLVDIKQASGGYRWEDLLGLSHRDHPTRPEFKESFCSATFCSEALADRLTTNPVLRRQFVFRGDRSSRALLTAQDAIVDILPQLKIERHARRVLLHATSLLYEPKVARQWAWRAAQRMTKAESSKLPSPG